MLEWAIHSNMKPRGEAVILGSGTSTGVPVLGFEYPPEFLAEPKNHRLRPSLLLKGPTGNVVVDCTPDFRAQMLRENVLDLEAAIITHTHADHIMGMDDLRSYSLKSKLPVPVYSLPCYLDDIRRVFPYAFGDFPPGVEVPRFDLITIPDVLHLGGLELHIFVVDHGPLPCIALRVGDFAYITDVSHIPSPVMDAMGGLDCLILDAVRYKPHPNHFHFEKAIEVAQEIGAQTTYFTHLSHDYHHPEANAALPAGINLAYDGLRIPLK